MRPRYAISPPFTPYRSEPPEEPEKVHEMIKRTLLIALQTSVALAAKTFGGELLFFFCILVLYFGCGTTIFRHTI
jgi:hypothetical protein